MPNSQNQKHLTQKIDRLIKENSLMKKLATSQGFYEYYFSQLNNYKSNVECFEAVNELCFEIFGEYRYSSYKSFAISKIYRKNK